MTDREQASLTLQDAPGVHIPPTFYATRGELQDSAATGLAVRFAGVDFPVILRPVGSQAGLDLAKIDGREDIAAYLARVKDEAFFLAPFIDYSGKDGLFRKFRIALVDGQPYACHMGVSSHWMVHYVNAGMYDDAQKRAEEAAFMTGFDEFARRHQAALEAIHRRTRLDYLCIDCAEMSDGRLLIFEIDHTMVVHAMDPIDAFPYKQGPLLKLKSAFRAYVSRLAAGSAP